MRPTLLVIAHEATRTGSPRVLLAQLRSALPRLDARVAVRLLAGGPLADDLLALADVADDRVTPTAVLVNGALAADRLDDLDPSVPVAIYVHEEGATLDSLGRSHLESLTARAQRVLCVSERVRHQLVRLGVAPEAIAVVPPVVAVPSPPASAVDAARSGLGVGPGAGSRLVVGCGEAGWRKGADLFVEAAARIAAADDSVRFAWIGRRVRSFGRVLELDVETLGLNGRLRLLDEVDDTAPHLAAADLLLMTSRDDPQPLVPLEAGLLGTPSVGFAIGGLCDFAAVGAAEVVPYPDTTALAHLATTVLSDGARAARLAAEARRFAEEERSVDALGPRFLAELEGLLAAGARLPEDVR